ncbi:MAG: hypothetical protein Kow00121_00040 [Elainellaceae cyanobacterium]
MSQPLTPRLILETLFPYLKAAAAYARHIQAQIAAHPEKEADNLFGAALTDADLSIQTMVEVALLGAFPNIRFYGEEYEQSYNTKYFRAIDLGEQGDYLVTLDPIDGTQFYLDGHTNYQIILSVLDSDEFAAVMAITPAENTYCYALRGQGCWQGSLEAGLDNCEPLQIKATNSTVLLGWGMEGLAPSLSKDYKVISVATSYSADVQIPNINGMLSGDLAGAVTRSGKFIDGAALAFLAQEAGCIVSTHDGNPLPPLFACEDYARPGLAIAVSSEVHQQLIKALQGKL